MLPVKCAVHTVQCKLCSAYCAFVFNILLNICDVYGELYSDVQICEYSCVLYVLLF